MPGAFAPGHGASGPAVVSCLELGSLYFNPGEAFSGYYCLEAVAFWISNEGLESLVQLVP